MGCLPDFLGCQYPLSNSLFPNNHTLTMSLLLLAFISSFEDRRQYNTSLVFIEEDLSPFLFRIHWAVVTESRGCRNFDQVDKDQGKRKARYCSPFLIFNLQEDSQLRLLHLLGFLPQREITHEWKIWSHTVLSFANSEIYWRNKKREPPKASLQPLLENQSNLQNSRSQYYNSK